MSDQEKPSLDDLAGAWLLAKSEEQAANARRQDIEQQIVALTGQKLGATTTKTDQFKIVVTGKESIKMDWEKWEAIKAEVPGTLHPIKTKSEVDEKGVRWIKEHEPEIYAKLPITVAPAKTGVEVSTITPKTP